jgi:hypothetical protein
MQAVEYDGTDDSIKKLRELLLKDWAVEVNSVGDARLSTPYTNRVVELGQWVTIDLEDRVSIMSPEHFVREFTVL